METTQEIWKDIPSYEGLYQVSNKGRIKSYDRHVRCGTRNATRPLKGIIHKQSLDAYGYLCLSLNKNGVGKKTCVHRIVALAFIPNPLGKVGVNHINFDKLDNSVENLEWATIQENNSHRDMINGQRLLSSSHATPPRS